MVSLAELTTLCQMLVERDREIEHAEQQLKAAKESARQLREEAIPAALTELGVTDVRLLSGEKVSMQQDVYASIPADKKFEAFDWLERHAFGGLIKTEVSVQFGKGELGAASEFFERLKSQGLAPDFARNVHPQTLKAWLRERLAKADPVPLELFGARPVWVAKIQK